MAEVFDFGLQQHKIKMDGKFFESNLFAVAGDTGRRLEVQLLDSDNMIQNTSGISLRLNANVAGQATYAEATLVDATKGLYELDLPNGMLIAPGNWQFQWQITGTSGEKLHSFAFTGSVGSNLSEGGSEATNFYLNADELKQMQDDLINGTFDSEALETNIAEKLNNLEEQYTPKLTEVTAQFAHTETKLTDIFVNIRDFPKLVLEVADTPRLQRALDSSSTVYLPDAIYDVKKLVLKTNNHLIGQSLLGTIINGIDDTVNAVIYSDLSANNYSIKNLLIKAPKNTLKTNGIFFDNVGGLSTQDTHPEIENVIVLDGYNGVKIESGVRGARLTNVRPGDAKNHGFAISTTDSIFTDCVAAMCGYHGFHVVNSNNVFEKCKAFCNGVSNFFGSGFKLQGSFNRLVGCDFQQNRFENLYLQNANSNTITGTTLDGAGWGSKTLFPNLTYADDGVGAQIPIASLRMYNSNKNIIDVTIINGRLDSEAKTAFYGQSAVSNTENDIRITTNDILANGVFSDFITDYPNAFFDKNKVIINGKDQLNKAFATPTPVLTNASVIAGGYTEKDGIVYVNVKVKCLVTLGYPGELLSGFPKPLINSAMNAYSSELKKSIIDTTGKLIVGTTLSTNDEYSITGSYIKA